MSTYLVAFVVCDFDAKFSGSFGTWARHDSIKSAEYALKIGPQILSFFESFFNIKFPLPVRRTNVHSANISSTSYLFSCRKST